MFSFRFRGSSAKTIGMSYPKTRDEKREWIYYHLLDNREDEIIDYWKKGSKKKLSTYNIINFVIAFILPILLSSATWYIFRDYDNVLNVLYLLVGTITFFFSSCHIKQMIDVICQYDCIFYRLVDEYIDLDEKNDELKERIYSLEKELSKNNK